MQQSHVSLYKETNSLNYCQNDIQYHPELSGNLHEAGFGQDMQTHFESETQLASGRAFAGLVMPTTRLPLNSG